MGGLNGDYTFTSTSCWVMIQATLPSWASGGSSSSETGTQDRSATGQADYLVSHGITKISDADGGTYSINSMKLRMRHRISRN